MPQALKDFDKIIRGISADDRKVFIIFCVIVSLIIVDDIFHYVSDLIVPVLISTPSVALFCFIAFVLSFGQYVMLDFLRLRSKEVRKRDPHVRLVHNLVVVNQYALMTIVIFLTLQIIFTFQYYTITLTIVSIVVGIVGALVLSLFAYKLYQWFRSNRTSVIVLLYGLSFSVFAFTRFILNLRDAYLLTLKSPIVNSGSPVIFPYDYLDPGSLLQHLFDLYDYFTYVSFGLLILATGILLYHYHHRIGKVKFWIVITLPLLYQTGTILDNIGVVSPVTDSDWFYWWLYYSLNATAGGILFGFAFMTIAKTLRVDSSVRQYMTITAYGFVLLLISDQVTVVGSSYPPVGLVTFILFPLASYMIFLGLYSTAVSISQDNQLRRSIRKFAREKTDLLSSIGTAHMEEEIQKTVNSMKGVVQEQEKELEEQTGIEANLEEDEMKKYLEQVMQEVGKTKK